METGREFLLLLTGSDSKMLIWGGGPGGGAMPCKKPIVMVKLVYQRPFWITFSRASKCPLTEKYCYCVVRTKNKILTEESYNYVQSVFFFRFDLFLLKIWNEIWTIYL